MVEVDTQRKAVVLSYDNSVVTGDTADMRCVNSEDGNDVSEKKGFVNDGKVVVTFPADYSGSADVTVTGSDGGEDTGTVTV